MLEEKTLVIIPAFNEGKNISQLLDSLLNKFPNVVLINDCSDDDTCTVAAKYPIKIISLPINLGQGGALSVGFRYFLEDTDLEYCITLDGDGQHTTDDAVSILKTLADLKVDIVFGTRFKDHNPNTPFFKRLTLYLAVKFERIIFEIQGATDSHNGLRAMTKSACRAITPLRYMKMAHATEIRANASMNSLLVAEQPVNILYGNKRSQNPMNSINIISELIFR